MPFEASTLPTKQNASVGAAGRHPGQGQAVVDDRPVDVRVDGRLASADRHEPARPAGQEAPRPGHVQAAVERRGDRDRQGPRQGEAPPLEVAVDDVELATAREDRGEGLEEVGARVVAEAARPQGRLDRGDETAGHLRVAAGEDGHVVAAPDQLGRQLEDDPLGAAVAGRRHALQGRRHLGDPERRDRTGRGRRRPILAYAPQDFLLAASRVAGAGATWRNLGSRSTCRLRNGPAERRHHASSGRDTRVTTGGPGHRRPIAGRSRGASRG